MRQSQTYRRSKKGDVNIDPSAYSTYRAGVAYRIVRKSRGRINHRDAWQLAAIPGFFYWILRGPIGFFKKRRIGRKIDKKLDKSNKEQQKNG